MFITVWGKAAKVMKLLKMGMKEDFPVCEKHPVLVRNSFTVVVRS